MGRSGTAGADWVLASLILRWPMEGSENVGGVRVILAGEYFLLFWVYNETKKVVNCLDYRLVCIQRCGLGDGDPEFVFADAAVGVAGGQIRDSRGGLGDGDPEFADKVGLRHAGGHQVGVAGLADGVHAHARPVDSAVVTE